MFLSTSKATLEEVGLPVEGLKEAPFPNWKVVREYMNTLNTEQQEKFLQHVYRQGHADGYHEAYLDYS